MALLQTIDSHESREKKKGFLLLLLANSAALFTFSDVNRYSAKHLNCLLQCTPVQLFNPYKPNQFCFLTFRRIACIVAGRAKDGADATANER